MHERLVDQLYIEAMILADRARHLIEASMTLHRRVARLDRARAGAAIPPSPALMIRERLALVLEAGG